MSRTRLSALLLVLSGCGSERQVNRLREPPDVLIASPAPDVALRRGEGMLLFEGFATDSFDAPETLSARWSLDGEEVEAALDGDGRATLSADPEALSVGAHALALHAIDSDGDEGLAEVRWTLVGAMGSPVVEITDPDEGEVLELGADVVFRGIAEDAATPADDLAFSWSSSLDGPLAGAVSAAGQSVLVTGALTAGTHTIELSVTDGEGETGADALTVIVLDDEPPVGAEPGDLVFSELNVNPEVVDDLYGEWVELYNTSGSTIDLAGYTFHDLDYDRFVLGSVVVPAGAYVVLCASADLGLNGGVSCDGTFVRTEYGGNGAMALGNSGDEVVLSRPDGAVIDEVVYDGSWFTPGVATGLDPDELDAANNDDETMWCDQSSITGAATEPGTPGVPNDPC
jgi:hypothetical protein